MRLPFLITVLFSLASFGCAQVKIKNPNPISFKQIKEPEIKNYIDSLKQIHYQDILSFSRKDLAHWTTGTQNTKIKSPLYLINSQYLYKLSIISGSQVSQFIDDVLVPSKINGISELTKEAAMALFGDSGSDGAITITLKKKGAKFNPKIAGLSIDTKNNLNQRLPGEPLLR